MDNNVITGITVGVSAIVTQLVTVFRERKKRQTEVRNREWDIQDRAAKAEQAQKGLDAQTAAVGQQTLAQTEQVLGELQKNTDISVNAFNAANDVNTKIVKIHGRIDGLVDTVARLSVCASCQNFREKH